MIKITNVVKKFDENVVLKNVDLQINEGEIYGIVGRSGTGKSTLLRCLNGLESYEFGSITVMDKEIKDLASNEVRSLRRDMGMIFQSFNLMNSKNVYKNISLPLEVWGMDKAYIDKRVKELAEVVGLTDKLNVKPSTLSGGQKQRVAIARALALNPKILLCDEATSALDPETTKSILELLKSINEKFNITIVVVTHQMEVVKEICNKVAFMEGGEVVESGNVRDLFLKPGKALKKLVSGNEVLPNDGVNIKIYFTDEISNNSIITSMARELEIDFSIVWGRLEGFRDEVLGSLIINTNECNKNRILDYLKSKSIEWEVA